MRNKPIWDRNISRPRSYIVGDTSDIIGDRSESAAKLINKLFGTSHRYPEADPPHRGEILPMRNVILPVPKGGKYFSFNHGLWGTGDGQIIYPEDGYAATLRPGEGPYFGAVAVDDGTTNILNNPCFSTGTTSGWQYAQGLGGIVEAGSFSKYAFDLISREGDAHVLGNNATFGPGTYYMQVWYEHISGHVPYFYTSGFDGSMELVKDFEPGPGIKVAEAVLEATSSTRHPRIRYASGSPADRLEGHTRIHGVQVEAKNFGTSFVEGSRPNGKLVYPKILPATEGTVCFWGKMMTHKTHSSHVPIVDSPGDSSTRPFFLAWSPDTNRLHCRVRGFIVSGPEGNGLDWSGQWYFYAVAYTDIYAQVYRSNGSGQLQLLYDKAISPAYFEAITLHLGTDHAFERTSHNMFSDLLILPYAASPQEIRALYEATTLYDYSTPLLIAL